MMRKASCVIRSKFLSILLGFSSSSYGQTGSADIETWQQWPTVGQARLSWFVFDVYDSRLVTPDGRFEVNEDVTPHPLALEIRYLRDISSRELLSATEEQWHEIGIESQKQWKETLSLLFPDIHKGDRLTYLTDGEMGQLIFQAKDSQAEEIVGHVTDRDLNDAFLAIWLSPRTQFPALRKQLIGQEKR
ncbi:chalcone isomerase family protein [Vibrio sp. IRLE0018]|uniref:chalcone isomerase family protein n=1 Tax=Vibrio floridensis TaxID=2908007 RepID=UPI001F3BF917|nr:chalcone isomerase family protein [Vibrio floridensis]MCF8778257.1 chalcone isomerase family protein [Vibrio floridensis]